MRAAILIALLLAAGCGRRVAPLEQVTLRVDGRPLECSLLLDAAVLVDAQRPPPSEGPLLAVGQVDGANTYVSLPPQADSLALTRYAHGLVAATGAARARPVLTPIGGGVTLIVGDALVVTSVYEPRVTDAARALGAVAAPTSRTHTWSLTFVDGFAALAAMPELAGRGLDPQPEIVNSRTQRQ